MAKDPSKTQNIPQPLGTEEGPAGPEIISGHAKAATAEADPTAPIPINRNYTGVREAFVDRFSSDIKTALKNSAWQRDKFTREEIPHKHFFDSIDRKGKKTTHLSFCSGHTHEFSYALDKDGNLDPASFKCGPAQMQKSVSNGDGTSTLQMVPVVLHTNPETGTKIIDDHTHILTYIKTEKVLIKV